MSKGNRPRKLPVILDREEARRLLQQPSLRYPTGVRNRGILEIALKCGLRNEEIRDIDINHLDLNTGRLHVEGKGGHHRVLYVPEEVLVYLRRWRDLRPPTEASEFFTTLKGGPLSGDYLRKMTKRYAVRAGIKKRVYPHLLRHTYLSHIYAETKNIRLTQQVAGHARLETTMIYTHVMDGDLQEAMRSFSY